MNSAQQGELAALLTVALQYEQDVVTARQRARQLSALLGFDAQDQVRIATAVSEIGRNAYRYAGGGVIEFSLNLHSRPQTLEVRVCDNGPGIGNLDSVLNGEYRSHTGLGSGLVGTRRLMDSFRIDSAPGQGTVVHFGKALPSGRSPLGISTIREIASSLTLHPPPGAPDEVQKQNRELLETLQSLRSRELELERRSSELTRLNAELEETNRGVVALYAELDEKALQLRRADELKSRFLSHVSHEFRTPLNSILALAGLLVRRADGELTSEQERQVEYIRRSAQDLIEMVNDLLDLAKVESGKIEIHQTRFAIDQLFGALRGIMRPLALNDSVALIIEEPPAGLFVVSDESKVAQILRNLVSNALKFTERGSVRVFCRQIDETGSIAISVADTGIGIAAADQETIFKEFTQVINRLQRKVKGTGLGLPLSRKLAELLGGRLEVVSSLGQGSIFTLTLPAIASSAEHTEALDVKQSPECVLVIDDEEPARYLAQHLFQGSPRQVIEAPTPEEGLERARFERPALIFLDLIMPGRSGFDVLDELKADPATRDIPVVIHTSKQLGPADMSRLAGRQAAVLPKAGANRAAALQRIREILKEPQLFNSELDIPMKGQPEDSPNG